MSFVDDGNRRGMRMFRQRLEDAKLIRDYGPVFTNNYNHDDKVRVARIIKMINMFKRRGKLGDKMSFSKKM